MTKKGSDGDTPLLEWLMGGLGAIVFFALLAVLVSSGLRGAQSPPDVRVRVESIAQIHDGYVVEFVAENVGDTTAADVEIVAELSGRAERASARFDYLPPHSVRRGGVFFRNDPRAGALTLHAEGYADP